MILTKEKSKIIYGCAACLMVFHHLFGFPDRIPDTYVSVLDFEFFHIETLLSYFGKICIALYAFISGYGLMKKAQKVSDVFRMSVNQIKKFYVHYWTVFIIFVPYAFWKGIYELELRTLLKNICGLNCTYNAEWWYVKHYVIMLILFPFMLKVYGYIEKMLEKTPRIILLFAVIIGVAVYVEVARYVMIFAMGMVFSKEDLFEMVDALIPFKGIIAFLSLCSVFVFRTVLGGKLDIMLAPIFIYSICVITNIAIVKKYFNPVIKIIGKYSIYIWLVHTFFIYYYFQNIVFAAKYSILIFIWTMLICIAVSSVIDTIIIKCFKFTRSSS